MQDHKEQRSSDGLTTGPAEQRLDFKGMWLSGIIKQHIHMHAAAQSLTHERARTQKHTNALTHVAIHLMKIRWMLCERWLAALLIAVCPLLLIMMGCILENLRGIDFIWRDY